MYDVKKSVPKKEKKTKQRICLFCVKEKNNVQILPNSSTQ